MNSFFVNEFLSSTKKKRSGQIEETSIENLFSFLLNNGRPPSKLFLFHFSIQPFFDQIQGRQGRPSNEISIVF